MFFVSSYLRNIVDLNSACHVKKIHRYIPNKNFDISLEFWLRLALVYRTLDYYGRKTGLIRTAQRLTPLVPAQIQVLIRILNY